MKFPVYLVSLILLSGLSRASVDESMSQSFAPEAVDALSVLSDKRWNHGAVDCSASEEPAIDVFQYDDSSYILRQSKCLSFEAPFIYVLIGQKEVLVVDTGATESADDFPLYDTIKTLIETQSPDGNEKTITVVHSHSHRDHRGGDGQFLVKPRVSVVAPNAAGVREFFDFSTHKNNEVRLDLGAREITVFPIPGHQQESIAIYDSKTRWLLTGDTLYPGYIYVKHWGDYRASVARMLDFAQRQSVSAILGTHIEMTREPGEFYPIGTLYQPNEASLVLTVDDLTQLHQTLEKGGKPKELTFDKFVVAPLSGLQKAIGGILGWFVD